MFGNGHTSSTDRQAQLGDLEAIVCSDTDLNEDLISVNSLLDKGFKLTMESDSGELKNESTGVSIGVRQAIVCSDTDLNEDLISVNPLLDKGFKLTMESDSGE